MMQAEGFDGEGPSEENYLDSGEDTDEINGDEQDMSDLGMVIPPPSYVMCLRASLLEKQQERTIQWTPQSRRLVDNMLNDVYAVLQPTKEQQDARRYVIQFVDEFVKSRIQGSHITVFGSYVMGLYTGESDLDLSLNVGHAQVERSRGERIGILRKLSRALYGLQNGRSGLQRHIIRKIEPVMRAAVPVVKFVEGHTNIECDVSMENRDGVLKSELLGILALIDPRFRQLCFLLKAWAKAHNVNDSKKGTLNSLSIILLVTLHLQTRSPPILPSFSVLLEGLVLQATESCIAAAKQRVALCVGFGRDNKETVSQLFASFFTKLLAVESLWEQGLCASVYEGKWVSKVWAKNHLGCISVEDFADRSQNCARAVRQKEFDVIHQCFRDTVAQLGFAAAAAAVSAAQVAELKQSFFGVKAPKRPSEEPLVQPAEKQQRLVSEWASRAPSDARAHYGRAQPHQPVRFNHNRGQGYQERTGRGGRFRPADRRIVAPTPGGQVPHYAAPRHNHAQQPTAPPVLPQPQPHLHSSQNPSNFPPQNPSNFPPQNPSNFPPQNLSNFGPDRSVLGARPGDGVQQQRPAYGGYHDRRAPGYHGGGWAGPPGAGGVPLLQSPYMAQSQVYYPQQDGQGSVYRADGMRDQEALLAWQRANGTHDHGQQQLGHPSQYPGRHGKR